MHRLPPIPDSLRAFDPLLVGSAARLAFGGTSLHQRPTLWVQADPAAVQAATDAVPDADGVHFQTADWRVRPLTSSYAEALAERPVSLDAFGVRPDGEVIDPQHGRADLAAGRLRLTGSATRRPADLVGVLGLASELAITPPPAIFDALRADAGSVLRADRHRLRRALTRLLVGRRPSRGLQNLADTGLLSLVLPEAAALIDFHRSSRYHHKDIWAHTRQVVKQAVPRVTVRWAALLHDMGKVHTRSFGPKRTVHFLLHEELGAVMCEGIMSRLRFPKATGDRITEMIRLHQRANLYLSSWTDAAIRRFTADVGPALEELLLLSRADITSKRPGKRRKVLFGLHELQSRIEAVRRADDLRKPRVPKGLGRAIIEELGVRPGPRIGDLRALCDTAVRDGRLPDAPSIADCIAFLRQHAQAA